MAAENDSPDVCQKSSLGNRVLEGREVSARLAYVGKVLFGPVPDCAEWFGHAVAELGE